MLTKNRCASWMRAVVLTAALLIPAVSFVSAQTCTWNPLGNQGFSTSSTYLSMDVHPSTGEHYIAAKDGGTGKAAVWKLSGGTWTAVGSVGFSNYPINDIDLVMNPVTGEPYVLLSISYAGDLKASVMRYNGSSWVLVGAEAFNAGSLGSDPSLVFHPVTNEPYVAYGDGNQTERLRIKRFDGSSWVDFGSFPHTTFYAYFTRLTFDPVDATPYVVFQNGVSVNSVFQEAISVVKYDAGVWDYVGPVVISENYSTWPNILIDPVSQELMICYRDGTLGHLVAKSFDGTDWSAIGDLSAITNPSGQQHFGLEYDAVNGAPIIVYTQPSAGGGQINAIAFDGSAWNFVGQEDVNANYSLFPASTINPFNGRLSVAAQGGAGLTEVYEFQCGFPGCTNPAACNYDSAAISDDGSCLILGASCDDGNACTYDDVVDASCMCTGTPFLLDDGIPCTYDYCEDGVVYHVSDPTYCDDNDPCTIDFCDPFSGLCIHDFSPDSDGDGVCDIMEVPGCTDSTALNYDPSATDDNGSCQYNGTALHFGSTQSPDGQVDYVSVPADAQVDFGSGDFSVEMWFNLQTISDFSALATTFGTTTGGWAFHRNDPGTGSRYVTFLVGIGSSNGQYQQIVSPLMNANEWHHVAGVRNGGTIYLYIDGALVGSTSSTYNIPNNDLLIGRRYIDNPAWGHKGQLDEFRMWNRALSQSEIQGRMNCELQGDEFGLVRYFNFNQGIASADNSGISTLQSGVVGTPVNGTLVSFALNGSTSNWSHSTQNLSGPCAILAGGCIDPVACNYDSTADFQQIPCIYPAGCDVCSGETDGTGVVLNGDSDGDGVCDVDEILGCTNPAACNYDSLATEENGSCLTDMGCTDSTACNYNATANCDDNSCEFLSCAGCIEPSACNYDPAATVGTASCTGDFFALVGDDYSGGQVAYTSLAVDPTTGYPWVAYRDDQNSYVLSVKYYDGSNWVYAGAPGVSAGNASYMDMEFHPVTHEPYVVYRDISNSGVLVVKRFDGTSWISVGSSVTTTNADQPTISISPVDGYVYVTYQSVGGSYNILCRRNTGGSTWTQVGGSVSSGIGGEPDVFVNPVTNEPYIAFQDNSASQKLTVRRYNGSSWVNVGSAGFSPTAIRRANMVFHPVTNDLHVSYTKWSSGRGEMATWNGSSWSISAELVVSGGDSYEIEIDPVSGQPIVLSYASSGNYVRTYDGASWSVVGGVLGNNAYYTDLAIDPVTGLIYAALGGSSRKVYKLSCAVAGCIDSQACNYNASANVDDGTCVFPGACDSCSGETDGTGVLIDGDADDDGICDVDEIPGCTNSIACNYNSLATDDDGSCLDNLGCTNVSACNYNSAANCDNGSCILPDGCTDSNACNYDPSALCDDGSCNYAFGCMDSTACNYDSTALCDDGSCTFADFGFDCAGNCLPWVTVTINGGSFPSEMGGTYEISYECVQEEGGAWFGGVDYSLCFRHTSGSAWRIWNTGCGWEIGLVEDIGFGESWNRYARYYTGLCNAIPSEQLGLEALTTTTFYDGFGQPLSGLETVLNSFAGCTDPTACNYDSTAVCDDGSCHLPDGCTNPTACNYNSAALCDDGSCILPDGCTDSLACNYNSAALCDDGSCVLPDGCTDPAACNYISSALCDDGSCILPDGCTDPGACNYNATALCDDGSCEFVTCLGCTDPTACEYDSSALIDDGSCATYPGNSCDDGNAFTENDAIQMNCLCEGTPIDSDGDGISDEDEINVYGTDPYLQDSDYDGLTDGLEINLAGTNPLDPDTNDNGCGDAEEFAGLCGGSSGSCPGDYNNDSQVNTADLLLFLGFFGTTCE